VNRRKTWAVAWAALLVAGIALAQPAQDPPAEEAAPAASQENRQELDAIDRMLLEDEEVLGGGEADGYDPGDRRDPFASLLRVVEEPQILGPRPEGVPGLLIEEIEVTGVFVTPRGPVAQVQSADKTMSHLLRKGDQLYDGDVLDIRFAKDDTAEVVFRQDVRDPTAPKPFREVVKQLSP
jgi:hypothetical protein